MLRGIERILTYLIMGVVVVFAIVFLVKQVGLTTDLKESLVQAKQAGFAIGDLKKITELHQSSARVFFLSFFSFILLLIGVVIIIRGVEKAYDISEVKEKVRYHLRSTTPGVILVVLGTFLLAFSIYRSSNLETVYAAKLVDFNNYKIAMEGFNKPANEMVKIDSTAVAKLKGKAKSIVSGGDKDKNPKGTVKHTTKPQDNRTTANNRTASSNVSDKTKQGEQAKKTSATKPVAKTSQQSPANRKLVPTPPKGKTTNPVTASSKSQSEESATAAKTATVPAKTTKKADVAKRDKPQQKKTDKLSSKAAKPTTAAKEAKTKSAEKKTVASAEQKKKNEKVAKQEKRTARTIPEKNDHEEPVKHLGPVTKADVDWARQFQKRVTIYGYMPSKAERNKYRHVYKETDGRGVNNELHWAYSFLEKTRKGYEPKPGELSQYEQIIARNLNSSASSGRANYY